MNLPSFVFSALPLIVQQFADYYKQQDLVATLKELEPQLGLPKISSYDFIVVGGGTAGSVVAGTLAKRYSVLLLELGGDPSPVVYPAYYSSTQEVISTHPAINEVFYSVPQSNSHLDNDGIAVDHSGRMLGGSGSHNGNIYNRGSPYDYDNWAQLLGDISWNYENMLPIFKSIEMFSGYLVNPAERYQYYGQSGNLAVRTDTPEFLANWLQAATEVQYPVRDPNAHQVPSINPQQTSICNGIRDTTYTGFIVRQYPCTDKAGKLKLEKYSAVQEILIDNNNVAYGVLYKRHGIPQIAHAKKEVIISAGVFGSPVLLFKSGIGPADQLAAANIPLRKDVPGLGQNLWDHVMASIPFKRGANYTDPNFEEQLDRFHKPQRSGTFAQHRRTQAYFATSRAIAEGKSDWADVQLMFNDNIFMPGNPGGMLVSLGRPKSSGQIIFNTTAFIAGETENGKLILTDSRYFTEDSDLSTLIEGVNFAIRILEGTNAFRSFGYQVDESGLPSYCLRHPSRSDEYWACVLKASASTQWHQSGTAKMGRLGDPAAVLDSKNNVIGFQNLRVVDASAIPKITNSNINSPTMAIAAKATKEIMRKYSK